MDLGAYSMIEVLSGLAERNGIDVPRLRGYRLMQFEEQVTDEEVQGILQDQMIYEAERGCRAEPIFSMNPMWHESSWSTDLKCDYYLTKDFDGKYNGIRWDRIHGKYRKSLKYHLKERRRRTIRQYEAWNRYAGQKGILYVHARIGGDNWLHYGGYKLEKEPWFIEKVDDCFDGTYCDIYCRVDPADVEELIKTYEQGQNQDESDKQSEMHL